MVAPTIQHQFKGADGRGHQPYRESRGLHILCLGKWFCFWAGEANEIIYLRSLCILCVSAVKEMKTHVNRRDAETMQRNCLSRSSSNEVSLNHEMTLVTDGGEEDRDPVASLDLTFKDAHQIF